MTEFKKYVERRDSVHAWQFLEIGEAGGVVESLDLCRDSTIWSLNITGWREFYVLIALAGGDVIRVNRGDYIVRTDQYSGDFWLHSQIGVVPCEEFREKWEPAE